MKNFTQETRIKLSLKKQGAKNPMFGKNHNKETRNKIRNSKLGNKASLITRNKMSKAHIRDRNGNWIKDRNLIKNLDIRNNPEYKQWRKQVYARDNFQCKISTEDCKGKIEAHHILSWRNHPELRYEINNGITLCKFHHPRKHIEGERLSPYFQSLVTKNNLS